MKKVYFNILICFFSFIFVFLATVKVASADVTTIFEDNVENGINNWVIAGDSGTATGSAEVLWHQSERRFDSPTHSWYYGKEETGNFDTGARNSGHITSPSISIPQNSDNVILHFKQYLKTENIASSSGSLSYDIAKVEVSSDGSNWNALGQFRSSANDWETVYTQIPSYYLGDNIFLRFSFDSIDNIANGYEGWFVDDITVTADILTPSPTPTATPTPTPAPTNRPPVAVTGGPYNATEDQALTFNASGSFDPDGDFINGYLWSFDYANFPNTFTFIPIAQITHTYTKGGVYNVRLTVQDGKVQSEPVFTTVNVTEVNDLPVANAGSDKSGFVNQIFSFDGSASSDEEGTLSYQWNFGDGTSDTGVNTTHKYTNSGTFTVTLTVTDNGGLTAQDTLAVNVIKDSVTVLKAEYSNSKKMLTVEASSSSNGAAVLTVEGQGVMTYDLQANVYRLVKTVSKYPTSIIVSSNYGGTSSGNVAKIK